MFYTDFPTRIGRIIIIQDSNKITNIIIANNTEKITSIENRHIKSNIHFSKIMKQLTEYFSGLRKEFRLEIKLQGTLFQQEVWRELCKIPYGEVKSYKKIATLIKKTTS